MILAIGFVVMIGAISGGLAALATTSLNSRTTLETVRDREFAADGVIEQAITRFGSSTARHPIRRFSER